MPKAKQRGLGKGLNSIFGQDVEQYLDDIQNNAAEAPGRREVELPIEEIRPNPYQPRKEFDKKALEELSESIKMIEKLGIEVRVDTSETDDQVKMIISFPKK